MGGIDLKDKKILYQLDLDSRQPLTQIGKKVGLGRNVVNYRIKKMQEKGIIKNFYTYINSFKLGYMIFRIYIKLQYTPQDIKNEILNYFINNKNSMAVNSVKGDIDLSMLLWVKKDYDFYLFWNETIEKYGNYFDEKIFSIYLQGDDYNYSFLQPMNNNFYRKNYSFSRKSKTVEIDELDYKILDILSLNARIPLIELANKLGCSSQILLYRINNLKEKGVIIGFRTRLDFSKIGFRQCSLKIDLKDYSKRKNIIVYLKKIPNFVCLNTAVGYKDLEIELIVTDLDELNGFIDKLESKFPDVIRNFVYWIDVKRLKFRLIPKIDF